MPAQGLYTTMKPGQFQLPGMTTSGAGMISATMPTGKPTAIASVQGVPARPPGIAPPPMGVAPGSFQASAPVPLRPLGGPSVLGQNPNPMPKHYGGFAGGIFTNDASGQPTQVRPASRPLQPMPYDPSRPITQSPGMHPRAFAPDSDAAEMARSSPAPPMGPRPQPFSPDQGMQQFSPGDLNHMAQEYLRITGREAYLGGAGGPGSPGVPGQPAPTTPAPPTTPQPPPTATPPGDIGQGIPWHSKTQEQRDQVVANKQAAFARLSALPNRNPQQEAKLQDIRDWLTKMGALPQQPTQPSSTPPGTGQPPEVSVQKPINAVGTPGHQGGGAPPPLPGPGPLMPPTATTGGGPTHVPVAPQNWQGLENLPPGMTMENLMELKEGNPQAFLDTIMHYGIHPPVSLPPGMTMENLMELRERSPEHYLNTIMHYGNFGGSQQQGAPAPPPAGPTSGPGAAGANTTPWASLTPEQQQAALEKGYQPGYNFSPRQLKSLTPTRVDYQNQFMMPAQVRARQRAAQERPAMLQELQSLGMSPNQLQMYAVMNDATLRQKLEEMRATARPPEPVDTASAPKPGDIGQGIPWHNKTQEQRDQVVASKQAAFERLSALPSRNPQQEAKLQEIRDWLTKMGTLPKTRPKVKAAKRKGNAKPKASGQRPGESMSAYRRRRRRERQRK